MLFVVSISIRALPRSAGSPLAFTIVALTGLPSSSVIVTGKVFALTETCRLPSVSSENASGYSSQESVNTAPGRIPSGSLPNASFHVLLTVRSNKPRRRLVTSQESKVSFSVERTSYTCSGVATRRFSGLVHPALTQDSSA